MAAVIQARRDQARREEARKSDDDALRAAQDRAAAASRRRENDAAITHYNVKLVLVGEQEIYHERVSDSGPRDGPFYTPYSVGPKAERVSFVSLDDALQWVNRFRCYMSRIVPNNGIDAMLVLPIQRNGVERTASMVRVTANELACGESVSDEEARWWLHENGGNTVNEFPDMFYSSPALGGSGKHRRGSKAAAKWVPTSRTVTHKGATRKLWVSARDASVKAVKRVVKAADGSRKARFERV